MCIYIYVCVWNLWVLNSTRKIYFEEKLLLLHKGRFPSFNPHTNIRTTFNIEINFRLLFYKSIWKIGILLNHDLNNRNCHKTCNFFTESDGFLINIFNIACENDLVKLPKETISFKTKTKYFCVLLTQPLINLCSI